MNHVPASVSISILIQVLIDVYKRQIHYCVKGIEVPYIRGHIGAHLDEDTRNRYVSNIVFGALHRTEI